MRARYGPDYYSWAGDYYEGPLSAASNSVWIVRTTAPVPVQVAASTPPQPSGQSTSVSFVEPENRSGAPVTSFDVRCASGNGGTTRTASGTASPVTVNGLSQGRTYRCAVRAVNSVGASAWSTSSASIVVPAGPPTIVGVTATTGTATVSFTAPDGGPAPRSYRSECGSSDGGTTRTGTAYSSPVMVTSLSRGKTYTCRVWAVFDGSVLGPASAPSTSFRVP
ncbi:MAG: fibronectin type III domain-containing protein [Actinomycetota bacterium]